MGIRNHSNIKLTSRRTSGVVPVSKVEENAKIVVGSNENLKSPLYWKDYEKFDIFTFALTRLSELRAYYGSIDSAFDTEIKAAKQIMALYANRCSWPAEKNLVKRPREIHMVLDEQLQTIGSKGLNFKVNKNSMRDINWVRNFKDGFRVSGRVSENGSAILSVVAAGSDGFSQIKISETGALSLDVSPKFWDTGMGPIMAEMFQLLLVNHPDALFQHLNFLPGK